MNLDVNPQSTKNLSIVNNTIKYTGKGAAINDVGTIRSETPFAKESIVGYFEIYIEDSGTKGSISIGITSDEFSGCKHPGYDANSFGYLGEDGRKFFDKGRGTEYAQRFTTGDYIGCGYHLRTQEIFFTKNAKFLGFAFQKVPISQYYPTVGLHSIGEKVTVNLGRTPFKFDLSNYIDEVKKQIMSSINETEMDVCVISDIVKEYLLYYGYENTLKSISSKTLNAPGQMQVLDSLAKRKGIRDAIIRGEMRLAIQMTKDSFPGILDGTDESYNHELFLCKCQEFIELIRKSDIDRSISFMQSDLSFFYKNPTKFDQNFLQDVVSLMAYPNPQNSPTSHLLSQKQRELVADVLNDAILSKGKSERTRKSSSLDFLMRQLILSNGHMIDPDFHPEGENEFNVNEPNQILFMN